MKFIKIENKDFFQMILPHLEKNGYKQVDNPYTGGDDDYVIIDTIAKKYAWFEGDVYPAWEAARSLDENKTLSDLQAMGYF